MNGKLFILSGPSGVGKGSVLREAARRDPSLWIGISQTTRQPRTGELQASYSTLYSRSKAYEFVTDTEFQVTLENNGFLEASGRTGGNRYGTLREPVVARIREKLPALLEIEVEGAAVIRSKLPDGELPKPISVFLLPPCFGSLERRLRGRGSETEESIAGRINQARNELDHAKDYDFHIVNADIGDAAAELVGFMRTTVLGT